MRPSLKDLQSFAKKHDLIVHERVSADLIDEILGENGECPIKDDLVCPCDKALEIKGLAVASQSCPGNVFITQAYRDYYDNVESGDEEVEIDPEAKQQALNYINILRKARDLVENDKFDKAVEILSKEADNTQCGQCEVFFTSSANMVEGVVKPICGISEDDPCSAAKDDSLDLIDKIIGKYKEVAGDALDEVEGYHECVARMSKHPQLLSILESMPPKNRKMGRLYVAGKACNLGNRESNKSDAERITEAAMLMRKERKEWFVS